MFCFTSLLVSWRASSPASGSEQPTALQATSEIISKYHNVPPMIQSDSGKMENIAPSKPSLAGLHAGKPILDVVAAEMKFGISFLIDYCGIATEGGQYRMVFTSRFQRPINKIHLIRFISCPKFIRAPHLAPKDRELLRIKLDAGVDRIPKEVWDKLKSRYNIIRKEWFIFSDD
ncbi:hypothetical protein IFM51744_09333 [Aspergillus udagawae]|nr:hypothetical protein IFM51744_09333 [Aspergillus udagawae]